MGGCFCRKLFFKSCLACLTLAPKCPLYSFDSLFWKARVPLKLIVIVLVLDRVNNEYSSKGVDEG